MQARLEAMFQDVGVSINGTSPINIQIHDPKVYQKILQKGSIGAGEAYVEGLWDCNQLEELFYRICRYKLYDKIYSPFQNGLRYLKNTLLNQQSIKKSKEVAIRHYNLGNRMYECMLGKSMAYTCGYWKTAKTLDEAQFAKYDLVCKKLNLKAGEKVLEMGCGWGGLARYMAEQYGCEVVGMDIGEGPAQYAEALCKDFPVRIFQCDYRETNIYNPKKIQFDKIVSVGVLEHVGYKNYKTLMNIANAFLKKDGILLLHSIGGNKTKHFCEPWIDQYIFPHGMLPSLKQLGKTYEKTCIIEDHHNFGAFYNKTLLAWNDNLEQHWPELKSQYDESFRRMMRYYLLSCAGGFRARDMQLWQFVLTPNGMLNGYQSLR